MLSWWAPIITVFFDVPGIVAIMLDWPQVWANGLAVTVLLRPDAEMTVWICLRSQAEDCLP
jgi:hypothetical protein